MNQFKRIMDGEGASKTEKRERGREIYIEREREREIYI